MSLTIGEVTEAMPKVETFSESGVSSDPTSSLTWNWKIRVSWNLKSRGSLSLKTEAYLFDEPFLAGLVDGQADITMMCPDHKIRCEA